MKGDKRHSVSPPREDNKRLRASTSPAPPATLPHEGGNRGDVFSQSDDNKCPRVSRALSPAASDEIESSPRSGKETLGLAHNQAGTTEDTRLTTIPASGSSGGGATRTGCSEDASGELVMCPCNAGRCLVLTSNLFSGRTYFRCPKQDNGGCNYFMWCDAAAQDPATNTCSMPDRCPYPLQAFPKEYLFEFFLDNQLISRCTPLTQKIKDKAIVTSYMVPGAKEAQYRSYSRESPFAQWVVHSIVLFLSNLQEAGWTLNGGFELADFFVTPFGRFVMCEEKSKSLLKASDDANKCDFLQVDKIIRKDIFLVDETGQLPINLEIFGGLLREFEEKNRSLVKNSASLMSHAKQMQLLSKMYKKMLALEKTDPKKHTVIFGKLPYIDPKVKVGENMYWKIRAETHNKYLSYHLAYTSVDEKQPKNIEKTEVTKAKSESARGDVKLSLEKEKSVSESAAVDSGSAAVDVKEEPKLGPNYPPGGQGQVKLIRNCDEHLHENHGVLQVRPGELVVSFEKNNPIAEYRDNGDLPKCVEIFSQEEVGYIIDQSLPGTIVMLQKAMHEAGELDNAL